MHTIDQLDIEVAEKVMSLTVYCRNSKDKPPFIWSLSGPPIDLPLYTKTHADDALVLQHIVSAWSAHRMNQFWEELSKILATRHFGFEGFDLVSIAFIEYYEPGDFSRAALAVVNND